MDHLMPRWMRQLEASCVVITHRLAHTYRHLFVHTYPPHTLYESESCLRPCKLKISLGRARFHLWLTCTCLTSHMREFGLKYGLHHLLGAQSRVTGWREEVWNKRANEKF